MKYIIVAALSITAVACNSEVGTTIQSSTDSTSPTSAPPTGSTSASPGPSASPTARPTATPTPTPRPTATPGPTRTVGDIAFTVYYTVVESFRTGAPTSVSGCLQYGCRTRGVIGTYPADFLKGTKDNGTGRITTGTHAGKYLNWSYDIGYWLDTAPRDARGQALIPYVSAAADIEVLDYGVNFKITDCGYNYFDSRRIDATVCAQLTAGDWEIFDRFTPGYGGEGHIDLYIGEEDQMNFYDESPKVISSRDSVIAIEL